MTFMTGLQCHLCGTKFPAEALWVCDQCLGPLEVVYDYAGVREALTRDIIEKRAAQRVAVPGAAADHGGAAHRVSFRLHAARPRGPPREEARAAGAVHQGRLGEPSDAVLQGSRRLDGGHARGRARVQGVRLRVDRQSRQQRLGACGAPRARLLRLHPARSRARQGSRLRRSSGRTSSASAGTTTM